jgi:hypothetical protein
VRAPHPSCVAPDEARVLALLDERRPVDELLRSGLAERARIVRLLAFLDAVELLEVEDPALPAAYAALGLDEGASLDEVKRAWHRLARDLHPDLHPERTDEERRALAARFHTVRAAYRRLVPGG